MDIPNKKNKSNTTAFESRMISFLVIKQNTDKERKKSRTKTITALNRAPKIAPAENHSMDMSKSSRIQPDMPSEIFSSEFKPTLKITLNRNPVRNWHTNMIKRTPSASCQRSTKT